jgi:hypothetical protein
MSDETLRRESLPGVSLLWPDLASAEFYPGDQIAESFTLFFSFPFFSGFSPCIFRTRNQNERDNKGYPQKSITILVSGEMIPRAARHKGSEREKGAVLIFFEDGTGTLISFQTHFLHFVVKTAPIKCTFPG